MYQVLMHNGDGVSIVVCSTHMAGTKMLFFLKKNKKTTTMFPGKTPRSRILSQPGRLATREEVRERQSSAAIFLVWL